MAAECIQGDCLEIMRTFADRSFDLVFCSPPYEAQRTYSELGFNLKGQVWVDWCVERYLECLRVCKGLVAWVVDGPTRSYRWSATPALLMADLHRKGVNLRKPPFFHRVGIPGSGGPDWLRSNVEWIVCGTQQKGRLPWADPCATGKPCRHEPGGQISHRQKDGERVNGKMRRMLAAGTPEPKVAAMLEGGMPPGAKLHTKSDGDKMRVQCYTPPKIANPGNVIHCKVGGGRMGSQLAHETEAAFPEQLADFFIRSFCPPGGMVLDPFSGSATTLAAAIKCGRNAVGIDVRASQIELGNRRIAEAMSVVTKESA